MAKGAYVGVNGIARKVKKPYVGVSGIARGFFPGLYFVTQYIDPYPDNNNTQTVTYGEGTLTVYQKSTTPTESDYADRAIVRAKLYGLTEGDVIAFDWDYDGPGSSTSTVYYADVAIQFGNDDDEKLVGRSKDGSGSVEHTVTADDVGKGYLRFEVNNGRGSNQTQTLTITNFTVNGELVNCEEET